MQLSDEEIISRVQQGATQEYFQLFDRYYSRVESYARKQMQNSEAARDVASETFLRAYKKVNEFRIGEISYLGYLLLICRRLIYDEWAHTRRVPMFSLEICEEEIEKCSKQMTPPLHQVLQDERAEMLRTAMELLPNDDREIIHLAYEKDLSRHDIGEVMGKPSVSAVTSHLYRAMRKLKAILIEQAYFQSEWESVHKHHVSK